MCQLARELATFFYCVSFLPLNIHTEIAMRIFIIPSHLVPFFNSRSAEAKAARSVLGLPAKVKPLVMYELYAGLDKITDNVKKKSIAAARWTLCRQYGLCVQEQHVMANGTMLGWFTELKASNMSGISFHGKAHEFDTSGRVFAIPR
jgi:hypothetical protein